MTNSSEAGKPSARSGVRPGYKIALYAGAWVAALFATNPSGGLSSLVWMFPLGLAAFFNRRWGNDGGWGVFGACIVIYLVHAWFYFRSRSRRSTLLLLGALVFLFVINVPGCRAMINTH